MLEYRGPLGPFFIIKKILLKKSTECVKMNLQKNKKNERPKPSQSFPLIHI